MGRLIKAISKDKTVLACVGDTTDLAAQAEKIHESSAVVSAAAGRLLTAACMMAYLEKNEGDTVTVRVDGGGPIGYLLAVGEQSGGARVTVLNPIVELPLKPDGKLDVSAAVGKNGSISVVRDSGKGEPQTGICTLQSGEIAEDIAKYYAVSQQTPTLCALGVLVNPDLSVGAAGGILISLMPGATEQTIEKLENNSGAMPPISSLINDGYTPEQILALALKDFEYDIIDERETCYRCRCSRERALRTLASLPKTDRIELAQSQASITVECHFCDGRYTFTSEQIMNIDKLNN
jgi:molecular chaperone Hsp33